MSKLYLIVFRCGWRRAVAHVRPTEPEFWTTSREKSRISLEPIGYYMASDVGQLEADDSLHGDILPLVLRFWFQIEHADEMKIK